MLKNITLADLFMAYRSNNNLTQLKLAKKLEVSRSYVARIESGNNKKAIELTKKLIEIATPREKEIIKRVMLNILGLGE